MNATVKMEDFLLHLEDDSRGFFVDVDIMCNKFNFSRLQ